MPPRHQSRPRLLALLAALCVIPPIVFVAALSWLKQQPDERVFLLTGITATVVITASFLLDVFFDRRLDEVQRSNSRFSVKWGWALASSLVALMLAFSPVHDLIVHWAGVWGDEPNPDRRLVLITFTFGFAAVVLTQTLCMVLLSIGWTFWKSRPARDPA